MSTRPPRFRQRSRPRVVVASLLCIGFASACDQLVETQPVPTAANRILVSARKAAIAVSDTFTGSRYIVRFKDDVPNHRELTNTMLRAHSGHLIHTYDRVFKGFDATLPNESAVEAIRKNPNVKYIISDDTATLSSVESPVNWGLDRIDQHYSLGNSFNYFQTGSGVNLYIIGAGIDTTHSEFAGRIGNYSFTSVYPYDAYQDCNGHGTEVASVAAGTVAGVAKGAILNPFQVGTCAGSVSEGDVVSAIDWIIQVGSQPGVINLSLGFPVDLYNPVDDAVNDAVDEGFHVVVAAGNSGDDACDYSPARVSDAVTVGASNSSDSRVISPWSSNYGSCVDLFAPGLGVKIADLSGGFTTGGGTSFSAPYVTGTLALILEELPNLTPAGGQQLLKQTSTTSVLSNVGSGSPNRLLYSPHTKLYEISGPDAIGDYPGNRTWSVSAIGGGSTYSYEWYIDYDDDLVDDEYPSETGDELTWYIDNTKGDFTVGVWLVTYIDAIFESQHVVVVP